MTLPTPARQRDTAAHPAKHIAAHIAVLSGLDTAALMMWRDLVIRRGAFSTPNRNRPSPAVCAVLEALRVEGELHIGAIARAAHRDPGNLSKYTLPHLYDLGVIERGDTVVLSGGGRPAQFWHLTRTGRQIAEAFAPAVAVAA